MENRKWLKRKYPESFERINNFFDDSFLKEFRENKMRIGVLTSDVLNVVKYNKGSIVAFKKSNPITNFNYPSNYGVFKCEKGFTESGYHSVMIFENQFTELTN